MVKIRESSDGDRLDAIVQEAADASGLRLVVTGWSRKTYELFAGGKDPRESRLLVQLETFATTNGEIRVFDDDGLEAAARIGEALEKAFPIGEAVIVRA